MAVPSGEAQRALFRQLMQNFHATGQASPTVRWPWLEAAHAVGQSQIALHAASHLAMLRLALQTGARREAGGQLLRLALVPLGHLTGRLPAGNTGRAGVSAFAPMPVDARLQRLIDQAATPRDTTAN
ncbi:MAG: hypothetical protein JWP47_1108 [Polaromonas sp.]|nr:hypothetical protein [Polaromonas sp.]